MALSFSVSKKEEKQQNPYNKEQVEEGLVSQKQLEEYTNREKPLSKEEAKSLFSNGVTDEAIKVSDWTDVLKATQTSTFMPRYFGRKIAHDAFTKSSKESLLENTFLDEKTIDDYYNMELDEEKEQQVSNIIINLKEQNVKGWNPVLNTEIEERKGEFFRQQEQKINETIQNSRMGWLGNLSAQFAGSITGDQATVEGAAFSLLTGGLGAAIGGTGKVSQALAQSRILKGLSKTKNSNKLMKQLSEMPLYKGGAFERIVGAGTIEAGFELGLQRTEIQDFYKKYGMKGEEEFEAVGMAFLGGSVLQGLQIGAGKLANKISGRGKMTVGEMREFTKNQKDYEKVSSYVEDREAKISDLEEIESYLNNFKDDVDIEEAFNFETLRANIDENKIDIDNFKKEYKERINKVKNEMDNVLNTKNTDLSETELEDLKFYRNKIDEISNNSDKDVDNLFTKKEKEYINEDIDTKTKPDPLNRDARRTKIINQKEIETEYVKEYYGEDANLIDREKAVYEREKFINTQSETKQEYDLEKERLDEEFNTDEANDEILNCFNSKIK